MLTVRPDVACSCPFLFVFTISCGYFIFRGFFLFKVLHINPAHKNSLKAAELCKEYDAAIEEQKQVELAKERELNEDKKRDEAETTAKTSPPKSPHQTAAFKKFNTPASSRVSSFRQDSSYNNSHTKQVAKVQEYSTEPQSSNSTHVSTPQNEATPTVFYSYDELKSPGPYPPDVTASTERELFLSEEDFFKVRSTDVVTTQSLLL